MALGLGTYLLYYENRPQLLVYIMALFQIHFNIQIGPEKKVLDQPLVLKLVYVSAKNKRIHRRWNGITFLHGETRGGSKNQGSFAAQIKYPLKPQTGQMVYTTVMLLSQNKCEHIQVCLCRLVQLFIRRASNIL